MRAISLVTAVLISVVAGRAYAWVGLGNRIESSKYVEVWKNAVPQAFRPGEPAWREVITDYDGMNADGSGIESYRPRLPGDQSCTLYRFSPGYLLTICNAERTTVAGLYDAGSQQKLDERTVPDTRYNSADVVRLMCSARWNLRILGEPHGAAKRRDWTFYVEQNAKLARIATFDARYQFEVPDRELTSEEIQYAVDSHLNFDAEHIGFVRAVDRDHDGFNERIELTTRKFTRTGHAAMRLESPHVIRTLIWNAKTHAYEE